MSAYDPSPADAPEKVAYYMSYLCWAILAVTVLKQVLAHRRAHRLRPEGRTPIDCETGHENLVTGLGRTWIYAKLSCAC